MILSTNSAPVKIDIYTESLCPFCYRFLVNSFTQFFLNQDRDNLAIVNFYTFGNSNRVVDNNNNISFTCQHGPSECYGNVIQSCGKNYLSRDNFYRLMICTSDKMYTLNKDFNKIAAACIPDADLLNTIITCANGNEGTNLQNNLFTSKPSVVNHTPFIVVNNIYDANVESSIFNNMNKYLCSLGDNKYLAGCKALGY